jgi:hypothetical protein
LYELTRLYRGETLRPAPNFFDDIQQDTAPVSPTKLAALQTYLEGVPQTISLPNDLVRPDVQTYSRGRSVFFGLPKDQVGSIQKRLGCSPMSVTLAVFAAAMHLFAARQAEFMVGIPLANRLSAAAAESIGYCEWTEQY